jgi:hypothetical protein
MIGASRGSARLCTLAAIVLASSAVASACALLPGPEITCHKAVATEECDRAVEMARPLLAAYWDKASEVLVHPGVCSRPMICSERQATHPDFLTIELMPALPGSASVVIDRHRADWTATCRLIVADENGAHGERCAEG